MIDERSLLDRFRRYATRDTTSDRHSSTIPTTESQREFAGVLAAELRALGARSIDFDERAFVIARFDASPPRSRGETASPTIGLMAHMDTSADAPGRGVSPTVHTAYNGNPIVLKEGVVLDPAEFPELASHAGDTIVTSDGTTLLGADDKAGIAIIMTALEHLASHPDLPRCGLEVIFTPDEETGLAMRHFPISKLACSACYTVDGGEEGSIETECFEAYRVKVDIKGRSIHLGTARGKLANAVTMAGSFLGMIPRSESPEATDERYGYYCPLEISGTLEKTEIEVYIRDFEDAECLRRIEVLRTIAAAVQSAYPGGSVAVGAEKQYSNMRRRLEERPEVIDLLKRAVVMAGLVPVIKPIRGGTDGSHLTELGIPTPNIFTGGHNYHSRREWASLSGMVKAAETLIHLAGLWAGKATE
jgi:tripeptide aminopeptidase